MTHILIPREVLQQVLDALLEARTSDDGMAKWDRNSKAAKALQPLLAAPCEPQPTFKEWTQDYVRDNIHKLKPTE
jgi:hypothetical protein